MSCEMISYPKLREIFLAHEADCPSKHLTAHIVFTEGSFDGEYSKECRTYIISSNNKAFQPGMGGYSIFGSFWMVPILAFAWMLIWPLNTAARADGSWTIAISLRNNPIYQSETEENYVGRTDTHIHKKHEP